MKLFQFIFLVGLMFLGACNQDTKNSENTSAPDATSSPVAETYQCPMKCQGDTTYTQAGQCPICKMDLEKI